MPEVGQLQVWWIPQVGAKIPPFTVDVETVEVGAAILKTLAQYDLFQFENRIKPDYCNTGGLQRWCIDSDGEGNPGYEDWYDEDTDCDDPVEYMHITNMAKF